MLPLCFPQGSSTCKSSQWPDSGCHSKLPCIHDPSHKLRSFCCLASTFRILRGHTRFFAILWSGPVNLGCRTIVSSQAKQQLNAQSGSLSRMLDLDHRAVRTRLSSLINKLQGLRKACGSMSRGLCCIRVSDRHCSKVRSSTMETATSRMTC